MRQLYEAHPAFGLRASVRRRPHIYVLSEFGLDWLRFTGPEQRERESMFFRALLTSVAAPGDALEVTLPTTDEARRVAERVGLTVDGATVYGSFSTEALDVFLAIEPDELIVRDRGGERFVQRGNWRGVGVVLDDSEVQTVTDRLESATSTFAVEDAVVGVDRRRKVRALRMPVARYAVMTVCFLVAWLVAKLLGTSDIVGLLVGLAAITPLVMLVSSLERRWYGTR